MKYSSDKKEWNLSLLFKGDNDPSIPHLRKEAEEKVMTFVKKWKGQSDYLNKPEELKKALEEYNNLMTSTFGSGEDGRGTKDTYYFWLRTAQDQLNTELKAKYNKSLEFSKRLSIELSFFELSLSRIQKEKYLAFLNFPALKEYRHFLSRIFAQAEHRLSDKEEKILNLKSATSYENWVKMVESFLSKEEREVLTPKGKKELKNLSEIQSLINDANKKVRDSAAEALHDIVGKNADIAEAELNSIIGDKKVDDELRKMPRPDYSRHLADDVESKIVDTLIKTVAKRFSISHRYYKLKARLLKLKNLQYHERGMPYGKLNKQYSYEEAQALVKKVLRRLDPEFENIFGQFIKNGNFDVYPRKGKRSGAFCIHWLITDPTYILLNYTGKLQDILTIAHESGHGINNELVKKKQKAINFGTPASTAEVASTFMEDFVLDEIEMEADDELKLALMMMRLDEDMGTIFRQIACYRLEQALHKEFREKGYLSKEDIGRLFRQHMKAYMGPAVVQNPGSENWWVYWIHLRYFFYVYSYSSGVLISKSLQRAVRKDPKFIKKVKEFLAAGLSDSPKNIFAKMGIDITNEKFWTQGLDEVEELLESTEKLAKKLGKL